MRKTFQFLFVVMLAFSPATLKAQQEEMGVFNHLAAGLSVGTTGLSFNVASPITDYLAVSASVDWMPDFRRTDNIQYYLYQDLREYGLQKWESGTHYLTMKGGLGRVQGSFVLNVYPAPHVDFYVSAGAFFGGDRILDMNGSSDDLVADINSIKTLYGKVEDYCLATGKAMPAMASGYADMMQSAGQVNAYIKSNAFRPYLGIGYGRVVPRNHRLAFNCELGVQFSGTYKLASDNCAEAVLEVLKVKDKYDDIIDDLNKFKVYPVLKFRLAGRIF